MDKVDNPELQKMHLEAKKLQAQLIAEDILKIADEPLKYMYKDENSYTRLDNVIVNLSKAHVDARK